jgi:hypothetical protein
MTQQGFSVEHPVCEVVTSDFALLASAVAAPGEAVYDVNVSVDCHPEPLDILAGLILDLRAGLGLHLLAAIDETGTASYSGVPPAEWRMRSLEREVTAPFEGGFAMPFVERSGALAASPAAEVTRQVRAPDGRTVFTVRTPPGEEATLEVAVTAAGDTPFIVPVVYQSDTGEDVTLIAAVVPRRGRYYTAMTLTGFDPHGQWSAGIPASPGQLSAWDTQVITDSVHAAVSVYPGAREAWERIAALAAPRAADAIREAID